MITVDDRCSDKKCAGGIYRMVGTCRNCGTQPILVLYSASHRSSDVDCPVCGCWHTVSTTRLATEDEIPEAVSS
jgi:hypothetical protein